MKSRENNARLSEQDKKIIELIAEEKTNKEIASDLNYSQRTIEYRISNIMNKLNVTTRVGIVIKAAKKSLDSTKS